MQSAGPRFIIFGGKGGVGKTTAAAATALYLARQRPEERILVVSTDPAHSLGDSFGQPFDGAQDRPIGGQVASIREVDNPSLRRGSVQATGLRRCPEFIEGTGLFALELDPERLLAEWRKECNPMIAQVADRGTYFDEEDIDGFLQLTLPGMDEAMAIMQIVALTEEQQYDRVVVDTAPTGHTLRLLALPAQMKLWIQVMDRLMEKHRFIVRSLVGRYRPDEADHWLVKMEQKIRHVTALLQDAGVTEFVPVTIPEEMAIYETGRLVSALRKHPLAVRTLIVNQVVNYDGRGPEGDRETRRQGDKGTVRQGDLSPSPSEGCPTCRQRGEEQAGVLTQIREGFADLHLLAVPQLSHEVQGMEGLTEFGQLLAGPSEGDWETGRQGDKETSPPLSFRGFGSTVLTRARAWLDFGRYRDLVRTWLDSLRARQGDRETRSSSPPHLVSPSPCLPLSLPTARFIMIGGKGGVGKTTTAAATALYLARRRPDQRILVFSTDPAHSVADSFDRPVGAQVTQIEPYDNLYAYEIDAVQLLDEFKREYYPGGGHGQQAGDFRDEVSSQMLDLIPPGLDEVMALLGIMELAEEGEFDVFILDTAPTGHLIRFLETPELAQDWLQAAARLLLKYKSTMRLGKLAEMVVKYSRQVRKLRQQLVDSAQTEFIAVTVPEAMAVAESERLLRCLGGLNINCRQMLVNKVTQDSDCRFCAARRAEEQRYIRQLMARYVDHRVAQAPQLAHDIRGLDDLVHFGETVYRDGASETVQSVRPAAAGVEIKVNQR
ncbi:MAG: ArsA family ATPase [Anaerolineae bacterium]